MDLDAYDAQVAVICDRLRALLDASDSPTIHALTAMKDMSLDDAAKKQTFVKHGGIPFLMKGLASAELRKSALDLMGDLAMLSYDLGDSKGDERDVTLAMVAAGAVQQVWDVAIIMRCDYRIINLDAKSIRRPFRSSHWWTAYTVSSTRWPCKRWR